MASQKFCGAVASQAYCWSYTCEFCKTPVERKNSISARVGSMHKSTTWVTTTAAGARELEEQARMQLAGPVAQMQAKIDGGQFTPPDGEDGKCPYCKKYQHWAPALRNYAASEARSDARKKNENLWIGCGMGFVGFIAGIILFIIAFVAILNPMKDSLSNLALYATLAGCFVVGEALTFIIGRRLIKKENKNYADQLRELEGLEKNEPRFIAWDELTSGTRGMTVQ